MHWADPEHTLSTLVITTDLPDLITDPVGDPELAMVTQPNSTRWLHIFCFTGGWVLAKKSYPCSSWHQLGTSSFPGFPSRLNSATAIDFQLWNPREDCRGKDPPPVQLVSQAQTWLPLSDAGLRPVVCQGITLSISLSDAGLTGKDPFWCSRPKPDYPSLTLVSRVIWFSPASTQLAHSSCETQLSLDLHLKQVSLVCLLLLLVLEGTQSTSQPVPKKVSATPPFL